MKKHIYILAFLVVSSFSLSAQYKIKRGSKEKIREYKIAYLTEKLNLSEKEAEKFWPVYNAYDKRIQEIRHQESYNLRKTIKQAGGVDSLSEAQAKTMALKMIALEEEDERITRVYYKKLQKILPYKKIIQLEISQRDFHRKLIGKLRHKRKMKTKKGS